MNQLFTVSNIWDGESFELALEFKSISENTLHSLLIKMWKHPYLTGVYLKSDLEPDQQEKITLESDISLINANLRGILRFSDGTTTPCSTMVICDESSSWVYVSVPESYFKTKYYFDHNNILTMAVDKNAEDKLVNWMIELANSVYSDVPFALGLVGWDSGCELDSVDITEKGVPDNHRFGILLPCKSKLQWIPLTSP